MNCKRCLRLIEIPWEEFRKNDADLTRLKENLCPYYKRMLCEWREDELWMTLSNPPGVHHYGILYRDAETGWVAARPQPTNWIVPIIFVVMGIGAGFWIWWNDQDNAARELKGLSILLVGGVVGVLLPNRFQFAWDKLLEGPHRLGLAPDAPGSYNEIGLGKIEKRRIERFRRSRIHD